MSHNIMDPIGRIMGLRYKSHPWHGIEIGPKAPEVVTVFVEMVPRDTVKYEIDKVSGYLKLDRPQKYSNTIPALYGFIPQTFCSEQVGRFCQEKTGRENIQGDGDPLDICVFTEHEIVHGNCLVEARPIGGFRMIDGNKADDKIIAVLNNDAVYSRFEDIHDVPQTVVKRLEHYFLTYKDIPGEKRKSEITHIYGRDEALEVIRLSRIDYEEKFKKLQNALDNV